MAGQQLFGKPPVMALQEFCAKKQLPPPSYDWVDSDDGSFICKVEAASMEEVGFGRSKRDAKHDAAANIIKRIKRTHPDMDEIPLAAHVANPTTDMIITLRDYCVRHNHPLPIFEIVQQTGPSEAPEFTVLCTLATIKRYGRANNKKDARQKAALQIFNLIQGCNTIEHSMEVASIQDHIDDSESERYQKFKTYRELTDSKNGETPGLLLCDRHDYFTKFFEELKSEAWKVIKTDYHNEKTKALTLMESLKIHPKTSTMVMEKTIEKSLIIELDCDYDVVFVGPEPHIYNKIINYFSEML